MFTLLIPAGLLSAEPADTVIRKTMVSTLPLINLPYQTDASLAFTDGKPSALNFLQSYSMPGMELSLALSTDLYSLAHYGLDRLFRVGQPFYDSKNVFPHLISLVAADFILTYAPGFNGWTHEEFHRSMAGIHGIRSFNDMNTFPVFSEEVSVNHVADDDLIRFKAEAPIDFIRMHEAGIEGEYLLIDRLQRNNFFYDQQLSHEMLYLLSTMNSISYVEICSRPSIDLRTDELNSRELSIPIRDLIGFDFCAWAYDLFNPEEAYDERGIHPSGNGIDRYIKTTDLSSEALDYLARQGKLQFLNLLSPMLFFVRSIPVNESLSLNFSFRDYLTSFGNDISLNVFLKYKGEKMIFRFHQASNYQSGFPALEAEWFEHPLQIGRSSFLVSPRIIAGVQPADQSFTTGKPEFLGYASCRVEWQVGKVKPWIDAGYKTDGWIAGNEYLGHSFNLRLGLSMRYQLKSPVKMKNYSL